MGVTTAVTAIIVTVTIRQTVTRVRHACTNLDRSCKGRNIDTITVPVGKLGVCEIGCGILTSSRRHVLHCGVTCYDV